MFDWNRIFFNEAPGHFLIEVALRSAIMFITLLIVLKIAGKRGVKQLSVFEMVIIISLGSAAGDPMFYEDVGIGHALMVFIIVLILYRSITWLTGKSTVVERFLEGETQCLIDDGKFAIETFKNESLAEDEFFTELRLRNVEHLGQVRKAYIETSGDISVFFYPDEDVKAGLPILPELFKKQITVIDKAGEYSCSRCGIVRKLGVGEKHLCPNCKDTKWVLAIQSKRIG